MTPKKRFRYRKGAASEGNWCKECIYRQVIKGGTYDASDWRHLGGHCLAMAQIVEQGERTKIQEGYTCTEFEKRPV